MEKRISPATHVLQPIPLAATLAPLGEDARTALAGLAAAGVRHVQLSATQAGLRPRDLDSSARRGLRATLRTLELSLSGIDLWIPPAHFSDSARVDRAVEATREAIALAADLGRRPVSLALPAGGADDAAAEPVMTSIAEFAQLHGVALADHTVDARRRELVGAGIDPAAQLASGKDPAAAVAQSGERLVAARLVDLLTGGGRAPLGSEEGKLDVLAYLIALSAVGFAQPVIVDVRQWSQPWEGLRRTMEAWSAAAGPA